MTEKITQIRVGRNLIGLNGLEEIFQEFLTLPPEAAGRGPDELLKRVAARNYIPRGAQPAYRQALWREFLRFSGEEVEEEGPAALEIKVLSAGCMGCQRFFQQVTDILAARDIQADLQYLTDPVLLKDYGVRAFPALVINGRVVMAGRSPTPVELEAMLVAAAGKKSC